jgi:uncharacterized protein (TIGR03435 family)
MVVCLVALTCCGACAQSVAGTPTFEVASVKLTRHGRDANGVAFSDVKIASPGRLVGINASLQECIEFAYQVKEYQISGPDWLNSDAASYDIEAKAPAQTPPEQIRRMFQTLLAERLKLEFHRETRTLPVYELVVGKKGPKLQPANPEASGVFMSRGGRDGVKATSERASMADLAHRLSRDLDRPVFDRTGITGSFRITLEWAREGDGPSIFTAIQEELGLKLDPAKGPIEVLVIDHAEKVPRAN